MTTRILAVAFTLFMAACATNPVTGQREISLMSEAEEIAYGRQADLEIRRERGVYDDPEVQRYVSDIGHRLARRTPCPIDPIPVRRRGRTSGTPRPALPM